VKSILIIQTAFLGDVILATPVVAELKRIFPDARIDFLVKKGNESLLKNNPYLNKVHVFDKKLGKAQEIFRLTSQFRKDRYDLLINLHRFGSSGIIAGLSKARMKYGFKKNPFSFSYNKSFEHVIGNGTHEVTRNLSLIKEFGAVDIRRPELFPSQDDFEKVKEYISSDFICLAPASVWYTKQLPEEKWIQLISKNKSSMVYLLGGPDDKKLCDTILLKSGHNNIINLSGKLNLLESAALMSKATMNYVNDSGPLHLASAMNAPVTAFFCSTIPEFGFGPLSDNSKIKQISEKLDCRPCGLHGHKECPKGHFKCGKLIEV
jgi:heptosyltransferase-2